MSKDVVPPFHVLIPAAGQGLRAGHDVPKQYAMAGGKQILRHTLEKFLNIQGVKSITVIIDPAHRDLYDRAVAGLELRPPVDGAGTRKQSVRRGLQSLGEKDPDTVILVHDAARPFVSPAAITALLCAMKDHECATLAAPIVDTLVGPDYERFDRNALRAVQTPQAFHLGLLERAHAQFQDDETFTDDAGLVAALGVKVALIPGSFENFKITTGEDMAMAHRLLSSQRETRTGFGYDVHAFDPAPVDKIRLGGVDIPHGRKLLGHSDADVILHALTDALLGTIGEGDIGQLFPPSDMQWKNVDSALFLAEAVRRVTAKGGKIINADITVIAEEPKIGPHRTAMIDRIATLLDIAPSRVAVKATTSEGLGYTGRREGIFAQAVATITLPVEE